MTPELRAALLAQTEARQALNGLAPEASDEDRAAAVQKLNKADQKLAELLSSIPAQAPEELRDRVSLGRYLQGIAAEQVLDGAEQELRAELKLSDQAIPLEALLPTPEERADAVSPRGPFGAAGAEVPVPSGTINRTLGPLLTRVFTATDTAFLGVAMPMVPAGTRRYPVMTDGTSASMVARGGSAPDAGAADFNIVDAEPHRLSARYVFDLEGVAEFGGLLESTLRADLRTVMGYQMDLQILNGDGTGANVDGILKEIDPTVPANVEIDGNNIKSDTSWQDVRGMVYGTPDGRYIRGEGDLAILMGQTLYNKARGLYRTNESEVDAIDAAMRLGARVRRSFQLPAPKAQPTVKAGTNDAKASQDIVVAGERAAAVSPIWQGFTMIRDPYTEAAKAQVVMTAHMLFDFIFRRKDGWRHYRMRTAA